MRSPALIGIDGAKVTKEENNPRTQLLHRILTRGTYALQGVSKKMLESGAHKTPFLDTSTSCLAGVGTCLFIDFLFLIV